MDIKWIQIYHIISTTLLLLWKLAATVQQENEPVNKRSACFSQPEKRLNLNCSQGEMVKLNRIFYGHTNLSNTCAYEEGHCDMDLPSSESYPCIGMSECHINLPSGDQGKYIPKCQDYGTYVQAEYQCIPESKVIDICSTMETLTSQKGYISTPNYPNNYPNNQDCTINLQTPHPDQKFVLYTIELILEENETDCADWLHIFDGHRAATYCGTRVRSHDFTTLGNTLEFKFRSSSSQKRKGFWLYFEAKPYMEVTTTMSSSTADQSRLHITTQANNHQQNPSVDIQPGDTTPYSHHQTTSSVETHVAYKGAALTIGAVIGLVVSLLLVVTVIILVILLCKRKEHNSSNVKVPSSVSCNSEAAFLNLGSNCYAPNTGLSQSPSHHQVMNNQLAFIHNGGAGGMTYNNTGLNGADDYRFETDYYNKPNNDMSDII